MTRDELIHSSLEQLEFHRVLEHLAGFAASSMGVEHILELNPLSDEDAIRRENRMVAEARINVQNEETIPLDGIYDIRNALGYAKIQGNHLSGENFLHIGTTILALRRVREFFMGRSTQAPLLSEVCGGLHINRLLERHIQDAIDDLGNVRDSASPELRRIRRDIIDRSAALRQRLQRILRKVSEDELVTEEYVTLREGRLVLPVKTEFKRKIPGIIHGESHSGGTVFLEPAEIFDMNNEIAELTFAERREVERILRVLTEELGQEADLFQNSLLRLQLLDSVVARARYAEKYNCVEPTVTDDDVIVLRNACHPLLQIRLPHVVPLTVEMSREARAIVISGPNAGGKTVAMKTLGLVTMMALCGIHPPATECVVHPCNVFTDIGDQQSIENDLSTFSAHMSRISQILEHVMMGDIVLLDEIGTGTDPDEGGGIAAAILEFLLQRRTFILATTHHSYLKVFAYETEGVVNAGMEFDTRTITPTYRCVIGMPGNSYAFELLERLGLNQKVLQNARSKMGEDRNRMTEIIHQLEEDLAQSRRHREEYRKQATEAEALRVRLQGEMKEFNDRKNSIIADAREEARGVLNNANTLIENTLREIRSGASNDQVKQMRQAIEETRKGISQKTATVPQEEKRFKVGDTVKLQGGVQIGELAVEPDEKGNVVVQFGALRMRAHADDLVPVSKKELRREGAGRQAVTNADLAETRIDLRGMFADEAVVKVEQAITGLLNAHINHLEIIHGKGTGALRRRIHDHLSHHPNVAEYRLGALTEGGAGVTIVELK